MFEIGKVLWLGFAPANLFVLALCLCWLMLRRRGGSGSRSARRAVGALAALSLVVAVTPFGAAPLTVLENRFSRPAVMPAEVDGIVILGGGLMPLLSLSRDEPVMLASGNVRLAAFVDLARRYPDARLVFTGGSGNIFAPLHSEASIARVALDRMGLDVDRVNFEDRSRNTRENAEFTRELVRPAKGGTWLLVTSASHMPRAVGVFRALDWDVVAYPVGYVTSRDVLDGWGFDFLRGLAALQTGVREWIGLASYRAFGHTDDIFPAP